MDKPRIAPDRIQNIVKGFLPAVRENLKQHPMLAPVVMLFCGSNWEVVALDFKDEMTKERQAQELKGLCRKMDIDCVLMITECYTLSQEDAKEFMENPAKFGSVSNHPRKIEAVSFTIETNEGCYSGLSPIENREIRDPEIIELEKLGGRFSDLLEKRLAN